MRISIQINTQRGELGRIKKRPHLPNQLLPSKRPLLFHLPRTPEREVTASVVMEVVVVRAALEEVEITRMVAEQEAGGPTARRRELVVALVGRKQSPRQGPQLEPAGLVVAGLPARAEVGLPARAEAGPLGPKTGLHWRALRWPGPPRPWSGSARGRGPLACG